MLCRAQNVIPLCKACLGVEGRYIFPMALRISDLTGRRGTARRTRCIHRKMDTNRKFGGEGEVGYDDMWSAKWNGH